MTIWTHLEEHFGARIDGPHCYFASTSNEAATAGDQVLLAPLSHYGFLQVSGPDAHSFLQGQTTADFRAVSTQAAQRGAYCTPKGRMLASFVAACPTENDILLRMRRDTIENCAAVLGKYAVFSKVKLNDVSREFVALGVAGDQASALIRQTLGRAPEGKNVVVTHENGLAVQLDSDARRYELWLSDDSAIDHWQGLASEARIISSSTWDALAIDAGIADVCAATSEELIPQMLNYDAIGAVNFKKGCYTGQEVVARLHYRGTAKRRLYRATVTAGHPQEGEQVFADDKPQAVGLIAASSIAGNALVVLAR